MTAIAETPAPPEPVDLASRVLDWGERALLLFLYVLLVRRLWPSLAATPFNAMLILAESMVVCFVALRRQTSAITKHPLDWVLALAGTLPPLFFAAGGGQLGVPIVAAVLMVTGFVVQVSAKFFLRRSFGVAAANRGVKIDGPYRLVRHPIYLGYAITWVGFLTINANWRNGALILFAVVMQILRILVEERLLKSDPAYIAYMTRVRYRIIPGLF